MSILLQKDDLNLKNESQKIVEIKDYEEKLKFYQIKKNIREELVNLKKDFTKENLEKIIENLL